MVLAILLIYVKNRRCPRTKSWETPDITRNELEILQLTSTTRLQFVRDASIQVIIVKFKPNAVMFYTNFLRGTRLNPFEKSIQIKSVFSLLLIVWLKLKANSVRRPTLKPCFSS